MPSVISLTYASGLRVVGEAHLVADGLADRLAQLLRDARGDGARGDAARLRVADEPALAAAGGEADLGQLRRLAGAGFAADDDDRMLADRARDLVGALRDRQVRRIRDARLRRGARRALGDRALEVGGEPRPFGAGARCAPRAVDPAARGARRRGPWPAAGGAKSESERCAADRERRREFYLRGVSVSLSSRRQARAGPTPMPSDALANAFACPGRALAAAALAAALGAALPSRPMPPRCAGPAAATCRPPIRIRRTRT